MRGVISIMGDLLFTQLLTSATVSPLITLVGAKHMAKQQLSRLRHSLGGQQQESEADTVTELKLDVVEGEITT